MVKLRLFWPAITVRWSHNRLNYGSLRTFLFPAPSVTNLKTKWSAPIRIYKSAEFFLDLPSHGDVKIIADCRRKVVKIIIENINYVSGQNVPMMTYHQPNLLLLENGI